MEAEGERPGGDAPPARPVEPSGSKTSRKSTAPLASAPQDPATGPPADDPALRIHKKSKGCKDSCRTFCKFVWNPETKQFMGRGCRRWALLAFFYIIFYLTLACMFAGLLGIVLLTLGKDSPNQVWKDQDPSNWYHKSLIQRYPAVILTPVPNRHKNKDSPLIWINKEDRAKWAQKVRDEVEGYQRVRKNGCKECYDPTPAETSCSGPNKMYGYNRRQPTFIVRLSKMLKWKPTFFKSQSAAEKYIDKEIDNIAILHRFRGLVGGTPPADFKSQVLIVCGGDTEADDQLMGGIKYCNGPTMDASYYPFENEKDHKNFLSPFIMIQFTNPIPGQPITVSCYPILDKLEVVEKKAWAVATFEFLVQ